MTSYQRIRDYKVPLGSKTAKIVLYFADHPDAVMTAKAVSDMFGGRSSNVAVLLSNALEYGVLDRKTNAAGRFEYFAGDMIEVHAAELRRVEKGEPSASIANRTPGRTFRPIGYYVPEKPLYVRPAGLVAYSLPSRGVPT